MTYPPRDAYSINNVNSEMNDDIQLSQGLVKIGSSIQAETIQFDFNVQGIAHNANSKGIQYQSTPNI